jgi:hypothetical protein
MSKFKVFIAVLVILAVAVSPVLCFAGKDTLAFDKDAGGNIIPGGSRLLEIQNVAVTNGAWTAITPTTAGKGFVARLAAGGPWSLSLVSGGTTYLTVAVGLSVNLSIQPNKVLFYVNPGTTGTLQILIYG